MEVVRCRPFKLAVVEAFDTTGLDDVNPIVSLQAAFDQEKAFLRNGEAQFFEELRRDDGVGDAGFIFEADENETFRGAGTLPTDHVAGDANSLAMLAIGQIDCAPDILQMRTQKCHWM